MEIQEAVELFRENTDEKNRTWGQDRPKINRFIDLVGGNTDAQEAISESNLVGFFETLDRNLSGYYFTLKKFYTFVQGKVLNLPISERKVFPLEVPKDMNLEGNSRKPKANYLPKGFDFYQLFNEDFYVHLHNETASRTIMACMAVGLGAGYNTADIIDMTLGDIQVDGDTIRVKNVYETESVPWIVLTGELAKFIKVYYDLRMKLATSSEATTQLFFEKYWNGRDLEVEPDIAGVNSKGFVDKPSNIIALMTYMLRYISFKVDIDPHLYPTHLYINTILHQLLQTDGKALESIIRTFGWERTFVRESFYQYIKYREQKESIGFNPFDSDSPSDFNEDQHTESEEQSDFFLKSSSDDDPETDEDILIIEFLTRKRDTKRVRELKVLYRNCCQICGEALVDINGIGYSEVNHIQPLSKHKGVDREVNMIVLCPNHHTLMDMGIITINPQDRETILHVDGNNPLHQAKLVMVKHPLSEKCIQYHHDVIFNSMKERINRSLHERTI
ncbi:HNH endonuclease [Bacillus sp. ISL-4]|uniref:HNH endonuclease n=1 Tax=Bacillus sp. ISL-4 TaxID=2819125 RepID=UPI001BEA3B29|nr:HNH endonuclease [Bacillus sp. ISL-4]MBT2663928.1 HNH endonuclease [Bacillus sp. ISL-4]MBT2673497.1 HNH endonuclease [Streptomyces sp. ISL-14]